MNRLESLDWLRGLLALFIMIYHLTGWKLHRPDAAETLGRLGIYGVSMFFVLSGLSMAVAYSAFIRDGRSWAHFFIRRIFRIWPLLWVAVTAVILGEVMFKGREVDWILVLLNVTTLFGFISPGAYINTGAWSIGNEMVYYALTPAFLAAYNHKVWIGNVAVAVTIAIGLYFGFHAITAPATLASQWQTYINPMNNMFFYCIGLALYYNTGKLSFGPSWTISLLVASLAVLVWYPANGDLVNIVTGINRIVFVLASTLLVLSFYKFTFTPPRWLSLPLAKLGVATYGVYLLHPIIFQFVQLFAQKFGWISEPYVVITLTVFLTILVSIVHYDWCEAPFIRLGKRLTIERKVLCHKAKLGAAGDAQCDLEQINSRQ
jgi:exopolysaccharide production protein ExoZ